MEENIRKFIISADDDGMRLDKYLSEQTEFSRSYIQRLIKQNMVTIDDIIVKKSGQNIYNGQWISMNIPPVKELEVKPEPMDLNIVYEDDDVILVDKPKGMVVHPSAGHDEHTLVNGLLYHCSGKLSGINGLLRPGIVHRIDRDTTGILVVCKNDLAHQGLAIQFAEHTINRKYLAVVHNNFTSDDGTIEREIARSSRDRKKMAVADSGQGRRAVTHYHVLDHLNNSYNYIECRLETGRTHQIRVHMAYIKHPLLGDSVYGLSREPDIKNLQGQTLHAAVLGFVHPRTKQYMEFESEIPQYFVSILDRLKNK